MIIKLFSKIKGKLSKIYNNLLFLYDDILHVYFNGQYIPKRLYIEPTNICNANCIFCAYQFDKRKKTKIDLTLLAKVVKEFKNIGGKHINLTPFVGEIFVDSNILDKIRLIKEYQFDSIFAYTNALLIHKFNLEDILNCGLTQLSVSTAPLIKDVYKKIYRNGSYRQLLVNLKNLLRAFNKIDNKTLERITIEFRSDRSLHECLNTDDFKTYVEPYLSKGISVSSLDTYDSWMGMIKESNLLEGMKIKNANFKKPFPCKRLSSIQITANGDVRLCGCRYNNKAEEDIFSLGNVKDISILEAYNSPKAKDLKRSFFQNNIPDECEQCSWYS